jgi:phage gpG-like protein
MSRFRVSLVNVKEFDKWLHKLGVARVERVTDRYLNEVCGEMVGEIKESLGVYQPSRGPFGSWPPLSPHTLASKKSDTPLMEEGDLKASVLYIDIGPTKKLIGATKPGANWHEYGLPLRTPPLPARPFVRPVVWLKTEAMKMGLRKALITELRESGPFAR